jgi:FkbM family methyltransferase
MRISSNLLYRIKRKFSTLRLDHRVVLGNHTVLVPVIDGACCDNSEPWMLSLLKKLLSIYHEGVFIDVGVNLGQTLVKVKSICPQMHYIGIEPSPFCVLYTRRLIEMNNYDQCDIIPAALFNEATILHLLSYSSSVSDSSASVVRDFRGLDSVSSSSCVATVTGEHLQSYLGNKLVSIVKIDVEGAELECLLSLERLIAEQRPVILTEILPAYNITNSPRVERQSLVEQFCNRNRYLICRVIKDCHDELCHLEQIQSFGIHSDLAKCDFVLVPFEYEGSLSIRQ